MACVKSYASTEGLVSGNIATAIVKGNILDIRIERIQYVFIYVSIHGINKVCHENQDIMYLSF